MDTSKDMAGAVAAWAAGNENIRAVILTSSRTNPHAPTDVLSDYDIELFVREISPFVDGDQWLDQFGSVLVKWPYKPQDDGGRTTRLVIYADAPRVDFQIKPVAALRALADAPALPDSYDIGYDVVLDKDGLAAGLAPPTYTAFRTGQPSAAEYDELVHHFWWNATYVAKYLYRDELFFAKYMLDDGLHHKYLGTVLSWYIGMENDWRANPGAFGRWFKRWLPPPLWAEVEATFAAADLEENWRALFNIAALFGRLAADVGGRLGYAYPGDLDRSVTAYLRRIRDMAEKAK